MLVARVIRQSQLLRRNWCKMTDTETYFSPQKKALMENVQNVASPKKVVNKAEEQPAFLVKRISENAKVPTRATSGSIGYDLYSAEAKTIPARGREVVSTDIQIAIPEGCYARVAPRSGLAVRSGIDTGAGVIDPDYRGTVGIVLFNLSDTDFHVEKGDRIAQLILERAYVAPVVEVESLDETSRGTGGYGSTGKR